MNILLDSFLRIFRKGSNSLLKIVIMSVGLAVGITLISIIYLQHSFDSFVPDLNRVYRVMPLYEKDGLIDEYDRTPGAIAVGIKEYSPAVETATRYTWIFSEEILESVEENHLTGKINSCKCGIGIVADSCFFDIFTRKIFAGDVKDVMRSPEKILISKTFAENLFGVHDDFEDLVGQMIYKKNDKDVLMVIGGVYADFPVNSALDKTDVIVPMVGISRFIGDGSNGWFGNDRYNSFVKLHRFANKDDVSLAIDKMCEEKLPHETIAKSNIKVSFYLTPLKSYNYNRDGVKNVCLVMLIVAMIVLAATVFNYILISISALVKRSKTIAVRKCYGANKCNIYAILFSDALVEILISLGFAIMLIYTFDKNIEQLSTIKVNDLFASGGLTVTGVIVATIILICGYFSGVIYWRTPISNVFRGFKELNRRWKQTLLSLQFLFSDAIIVTVIVVLFQYNYSVKSDPGYDFKNVVFVSANFTKGNKMDALNNLKDEIGNLPFVENQLFSYVIPMRMPSGNFVYTSEVTDEVLFDACDLHSVYCNYLNFFDIPLLEGSYFEENNCSANHREVLVSRKFKEKLQITTGWDIVVGREICFSEHFDDTGKLNVYTICGVYEDFLVGLTISSDNRPSMMFYGPTEGEMGGLYCHLMKLDKVNNKNIKEIEDIYKEMRHGEDVEIYSYSEYYRDAYKEARYIRDMILFAFAVILIITVAGLVGYINDEMRRRSSEVALRKINGATAKDVLRLFLSDVMKLALVAVIIGCVLSYFIKELILNLFLNKVPLGIWIYFIGIVLLFGIVISVVVLSVWKAANANPVESLKKE